MSDSSWRAGLGWLHAKLLLVFALSGYHGWVVGYAKKLANGQGDADAASSSRMLNELPALLVALIVILVVVKPF